MWRASAKLPVAQIRSSRVHERVDQLMWAVRHSAQTSALAIVALAITLGGAGFTAWQAYRAPERVAVPVVARDFSIAPAPPVPPLPPRIVWPSRHIIVKTVPVDSR
jgi:hypothetical protein